MKPHCATGVARRSVAMSGKHASAPADTHCRRQPFAASLIAIALLPAAARAERHALWEIGVGVAGLYLPD